METLATTNYRLYKGFGIIGRFETIAECKKFAKTCTENGDYTIKGINGYCDEFSIWNFEPKQPEQVEVVATKQVEVAPIAKVKINDINDAKRKTVATVKSILKANNFQFTAIDALGENKFWLKCEPTIQNYLALKAMGFKARLDTNCIDIQA